MTERIYFAANSGELSDGQSMLLSFAKTAAELGYSAAVVAPEASPVVERAMAQDLPVVEIHGSRRRPYMGTLRAWDDNERKGILWCNGMVPAMATAGRRGRVVHLHRVPKRANLPSLRIATAGAILTVVPSQFAASRLPGATVLPNWCAEIRVPRPPVGRIPATVGFLGTPTVAKGCVVLAKAVSRVNRRFPDRIRLLISGDLAKVSSKDRSAVRNALHELGGSVSVGVAKPEAFWSQIDLAVFCSLDAETFGLPVVEAMSARVPVVVSNVGALPEIVGAAHPWLAPAGDVSKLADLLEVAVSDRTGEVTDQAHDRWLSHYSPEVGQAALEAVLSKVHA